jgi:hypothetical protein
MAKPLPLPVWDRQRGTLLEEWMDDHQPHYESQPQRSFTQWVKSQPLYDRLYALYENSRLSTREIEPFIRKYHINMASSSRCGIARLPSFSTDASVRASENFPQFPKKWARSLKRAISAGRISSRIRGSRLRAIH